MRSCSISKCLSGNIAFQSFISPSHLQYGTIGIFGQVGIPYFVFGSLLSYFSSEIDKGEGIVDARIIELEKRFAQPFLGLDYKRGLN